MDRSGVVLAENMEINEAFGLMLDKKADFAAVVSEDEKPVGTVSFFDVADCAVNSSSESKNVVSDIMNGAFSTIEENSRNEQKKIKEAIKDTMPMVIVDEQGSYRGILSMWEIVDILKQYLDYLERMLDNIDDGIIAIDENNKIIYMNKTYRQIHSIEDNELIGKNVQENFPESRLMEISEANDNIIVEDPLHLNFSGATVMPLYKALKGDDEKYLGAAAIIKDYNEANSIYIGINEINQFNNLVGQIFDNLKEAVFIVNSKLEIIYHNEKFQETVPRSFNGTIYQKEIRTTLENKFKIGKIDVFHENIELSNNTELSLIGIPLCGINQNLNNIVVIFQDISHIKELKTEISKQEKLLSYYKNKITKLPDEMVCESENFKKVVTTALKVADSYANVIIEGENGVGKELIANLIHNNSGRADKPFIPVNCGAIPDSLWESEMFGYEEGAFTGANKSGKMGIFEMGDGGTVFLDEIGEISLAGQVKMLRFLQNKEIAKVGRKETKKVDVRIIVATNRNLKEMVGNGTFREDLYYRLSVVKLVVPPLRNRKEEIKPLALKFLNSFNDRYGKSLNISKDALRLFENYDWQGNIRQLRNVMEQSVIMCDRIIQTYDILIDNIEEDNVEKIKQHHQLKGIFNDDDILNIPLRTRALEQELILEALKRSDNNKSRAIEMLNIGRKTFYKKLKEYELT